MSKLFVPRSVALLMKKKGFNEKCLYISGESYSGQKFKGTVNWDDWLSCKKNSELDKEQDKTCLHPTWMQAINWLETKGVLVNISTIALFNPIVSIKIEEKDNKFSILHFKETTKEKTLTKALLKGLKLIRNESKGISRKAA